MAIKLQAKKELRIVPVRFERAITGSPDPKYPDIDDRGHTHIVPAVNGLPASDPIRGAVLGLTKDQDVTIKMVREDIDEKAPLFVTSSDEDAIKIISPADGETCGNGKDCEIQLKGGHFAASTPKSAKVEIRYGAKDGPIVATLTTYTFNRLLVFVQPHIVTINDPSGASGIAPGLDFSEVMKQVKALWACCGINILVKPTQSFDINLSNANKLTDHPAGNPNGFSTAEFNSIFAKSWVPNAINVYAVMQIAGGALGYGFSKAAHAGFGINKPSVFLGMKDNSSDRTNQTYWCANDLAHELGHFFTLWHPSDEPSPTVAGWEREETWSMRFLMHNYNQTNRDNAPQGGAHWPEYNDFGYGSLDGYPFRAGLISLKNVRASEGAGKDAHCSTIRNYIAQGPSALY
jgi:hypothetical protein